MVLGKLPVPGRSTNWIIVGQGPTVLAIGVGRGCLDICSLVYHFSLLSPTLWETARYRLKYCLKGPLSPRQPTNQSSGRATTQQTLGPMFAMTLTARRRPANEPTYNALFDKNSFHMDLLSR